MNVSLLPGQLQILWYSPRVPAGAVSAKGHRALGDFLAGRVGDRDDGIEREIARNWFLAVRLDVSFFLRVVSFRPRIMMSSAGSTRTAAILISSPGLKVLSLAGLAKMTSGLWEKSSTNGLSLRILMP